MSVATIVLPEHLPHLAALLPRKVIDQRHAEFERVDMALLWQMERDLALLRRYVTPGEIARAYGDLLRSPGHLIDALYEIRVAAMLASVVAEPELAPRVGAGRADFKGSIEGHSVFFEVTKKADLFPFEGSGDKSAETPMRSRATVEASFDSTTARQEPGVVGIPTSKNLRDRIRTELRQLPSDALAVLVVGAQGGRSLDMECALFGDERVKAREGGLLWQERVPNGLFAIPDEAGGASRLSAVVWMRLRPHFADVRVHSRLFINPKAARPLSPAVEEILRAVFDRRVVLEREKERITRVLIERYRPERIILFGSLAGPPDEVHEWSDLDLFVVKSTPRRYAERIVEVLDLAEPRVAVNVIVYTPEELERVRREGRGFVIDEILGRGRPLFP